MNWRVLYGYVTWCDVASSLIHPLPYPTFLLSKHSASPSTAPLNPYFFLSSWHLLPLHPSSLNPEPSLSSLHFPPRAVTAARLPGVLVCCLSSTARLKVPPKKTRGSLQLYPLPHTAASPWNGDSVQAWLYTSDVKRVNKGQALKYTVHALWQMSSMHHQGSVFLFKQK